MGLCHEFGTQIRDGCDHPMHANPHSCSCPECDSVCKGLFEGCPDVWERGPQAVTIAAGRASTGKSSSAAVSSANAKSSSTAPKTNVPAMAPAEVDSTFAKGGSGIDTGGDSLADRSPRANGGAATGAQATNLIGNGTVVSWDKAVDSSLADLDFSPSPAASARIRGLKASDTSIRSPSTDAPRTDVLEWFGEAFESLRQELHNLAVGMTQQEAMVAELLDTRQGELRLVLVAEALPDLVADAVRQAMADHLASVSDSFDSAVGILRQELKRNKKATDASVEVLRGSVNEALAQVSQSIDAHTAELRESEAARARAVKAAVTRQVAPLVTTAEESQAATAAALGLLGRKLDRLSAAIEKGRPVIGSPSSVAAPSSRSKKTAKASVKPRAPRSRSAAKAAISSKPLVTPGADPSLGDDEE